ncbi:MAG: hypothetical protein LWW94_11315 [Candidatus Desulfofervidaceae bacterium]|nr:hypothetical protein [Candidatus Desulfofervidaceae bacterium]
MIELKYKTEKLTVNIKEEFFELTNQGAHDQARYDFLKDISRIESLIEQKYPKGMGITIFLTNDKKYWELPEKDIDTVDKEFRIHEGRIIKKTTLKWKEGTSKGTKSGREEPICLKGDYHLSWQKYSCSDKYLFKYLAIVIKDL